MFASRQDWPAGPAFHPEFGILCPSPRRRRGMRLVMAFVVATTAIGATVALAAVHRPDRDVLAAAALSADERDAHATSVSLPTADIAAPAGVRGQDFCKAVGTNDPVASFLNPTCGSPKPRHGARAANRVATFILGQSDVFPQERHKGGTR